MHLFYVPQSEQQVIVFPEEEARHCVQVLRRRTGDEVHWTDGKGFFYQGELVEAVKKRAVVRVLSRWPDPLRRSFRLHIAIAPTKHFDRLEWFAEKATEIGIERITPLICSRSERKKVRTDRLKRVMIAAMKQSLRGYLPQVDAPMTFSEFMDQHLQDTTQRFIATCQPLPEGHLQELWRPGRDVCVLIGPEGDFSAEELHLARKKKFVPVQLGQARLRTETAGVMAVATIALRASLQHLGNQKK